MSDWLRRLLADADDGPWWFDGRDIFHKRPGTNLDQIIVPLGHVISDTYTADGAVNLGTCRLIAKSPEVAEWAADARDGVEELLEVAERIRGGDPSLDPEQWYTARDCARALLARYEEIGGQ